MSSTAEFFEGAVKSGTMILISEIGDKTFFIAAIMAMRHSRATVFAGAVGALGVMTALSAALGWAAPALISKTYTHYLAVALFFFFGCRSLYESLLAWEGGGMREELAETEKELAGSKGSKAKAKLRAPLVERSGGDVRDHVPRGVGGPLADRHHRPRRVRGPVRRDTRGRPGARRVHRRRGDRREAHGDARVRASAVAVTGGALFVLFGAHALVTGVGE